MESNWRLSVWQEGFWGDLYELSARLLVTPFLLLTWTPIGFPFYFLWVETPSADFNWQFFTALAKPTPTTPFPYGVAVQPD